MRVCGTAKSVEVPRVYWGMEVQMPPTNENRVLASAQSERYRIVLLARVADEERRGMSSNVRRTDGQ